MVLHFIDISTGECDFKQHPQYFDKTVPLLYPWSFFLCADSKVRSIWMERKRGKHVKSPLLNLRITWN